MVAGSAVPDRWLSDVDSEPSVDARIEVCPDAV